MADNSVALTTVKGGINRQRVKGAALSDSLYDLLNGYVTRARTVVVRPGTFRDANLAEDTAAGASTRGLIGFEGEKHVFGVEADVTLPAGYVLHVIRHPADTPDDDATPLKQIHFVAPFMGSLYVAAEFDDNGSSLGSTFHFWVQVGPDWEVEQMYKIGDIVTPAGSSLSFRATRAGAAAQVWGPNIPRVVGDIVEPTTYNGFKYTVISTTGTPATSGSVEPAWPEVDGAQITENSNGGGTSSTTAVDGTSASQVLPSEVEDRYGPSAPFLGINPLTDPSTIVVPSATTDASPWEPGKLYTPGSIVRAISLPPVTTTPLVNSGFEAGDYTGWSQVGTWDISSDDVFQGNYRAGYTGTSSASNPDYIEQTTYAPVNPGQEITAQVYVDGQGSSNAKGARIALAWYTASNVLISVSRPDAWITASDWRVSQVTANAPSDAAKVRLRVEAFSNGPNIHIDFASWNQLYQAPVSSLLFKATQAAAGYSGSSEPAWPTAVAGTVVDNEVTWTAVGTSQVIWQASPIMESGSYPPIWPSFPGVSARDGSIVWVATDGRVEDENCPNTKIVALGASKVFCFDEDIIAYSATANPLDWTTEEDAGYIPFGLQTHGKNPGTALALYRGNLMAFNTEG